MRSERRIEVGEQDVVGLDGLEAAGLQPPLVAGEDQRRRGVAHRPVALGGLALRLGRRALRGARLGAVGLVGALDLGAVERGEQGGDVQPVDALKGVGEVVGIIEHERRREPRRTAARGRRGELARGVLQARRDDRAAGQAGRAHAVARLGRERHPAVAEAQVAARRAGGRVAAPDVLVGLLGEADRAPAASSAGRRSASAGRRARGTRSTPTGSRDQRSGRRR